MNPLNINDDSWHHISIAREGDNFNFYLDGNSLEFECNEIGADCVHDENGLPFDENSNLTIGNGLYPLDGTVDNISIWNRALTEDEMANRAKGIEINPINLSAMWKFNSGNGDILYDHSGNQNHGTIVGATWEEVSMGCTDPLALNYDELAELDDGSCEYPDNGNYSLNFDGSDDYVEVESFELGTTFSFETEILLNEADYTSSDAG